MKKVLILFAHPAFERSRVNREMVKGLTDIDHITFHDLYHTYPELDIDRDYEQQLVEKHDIIIFHHPFFWNSTPSILKEWQDIVLVHGWAYGSKGNALKEKLFFNVISTGGTKDFYYKHGNYNRFTIRQLLAPLEQTVSLCKMIYTPPYVVHGTHSISNTEIGHHKKQYERYLNLFIQNQIDIDKLLVCDYLNDYSEI